MLLTYLLPLLATFFVVTAGGQTQTAAPGTTLDEAMPPGANFDKAEFRFWLPAGLVRTAAALNDRFGGRLMPDLPLRGGLEWALTIGPIDGSSGERLLGRPYRSLAESLADAVRWWAEQGTIPRASAGRLI